MDNGRPVDATTTPPPCKYLLTKKWYAIFRSNRSYHTWKEGYRGREWCWIHVQIVCHSTVDVDACILRACVCVCVCISVTWWTWGKRDRAKGTNSVCISSFPHIYIHVYAYVSYSYSYSYYSSNVDDTLMAPSNGIRKSAGRRGKEAGRPNARKKTRRMMSKKNRRITHLNQPTNGIGTIARCHVWFSCVYYIGIFHMYGLSMRLYVLHRTTSNPYDYVRRICILSPRTECKAVATALFRFIITS